MKAVDRSKRAKQTAECFTPPKLVNKMLDKLPKEQWIEGKTCCDPACGDGAMLVEVLKRRVAIGHDPAKAIGCLYGADIMADNIRVCRYRLLTILKEQGVIITKDIVKTVLTNIVWVSMKLKGYEKGSLNYDFSFNGSNLKKPEVIAAWVKYMRDEDSVPAKSLLDSPVKNDKV